MLKIFTFLYLLFQVNVIGTRFVGKAAPLRIHHGRDMKPGEFPFVIMSVLVKNKKYERLCTNSAINDRWLLTAAHCYVDLPEDYTLAIWPALTKGRIKKKKKFVNVTKIIVYPSYKSYENLIDNDICLLLVPQMNLKRYGRLLAADYTTLTGLPVTYVGGGDTNKKGKDKIRPIQVGGGAIIKCDKQFKEDVRYLICVTPKCSNRKHRLWFGDSGSPLLYDGKIVGVLSYGTVGNDITRDGYAPVSPFLDWIYEQIKNTE